MRTVLVGIEAQSRFLVRELARATNHPAEEVASIYEKRFRMLENGARVKAFLPILAARHARETLLGR